MNKLILVLLVVCLVSVHAFVKRDAPEAAKEGNDLQKFQEQVQEGLTGLVDQAKKALEPEKLKQQWEQLSKSVQEAIDKMKPAETKQ